jgi:hypothetical protein
MNQVGWNWISLESKTSLLKNGVVPSQYFNPNIFIYT